MSDLCPGIKRTVAWLQSEGFDTTDSGDGVSNAGMECALPHANVVMVCEPQRLIEEADRLQGLLAKRGIEVGGLAPEGELQLPHITASYDPSDGIGVLCLFYLDDKRLFGP